MQPTSWPDIHWDLNLQLTYWVFFTSNRVKMVKSLTNQLTRNTQALIKNVYVADILGRSATVCARGFALSFGV